MQDDLRLENRGEEPADESADRGSDKRIRVLFLSPEMAPYAGTGGLGNMAGSLPGKLRQLGLDVRSVIPLYRSVFYGRTKLDPVMEDMEVPLGGQFLKADIWKTEEEDGGIVYFVDREDLYDRPNLYGQDRQGDYYDNLERFVFFSRAGILLAKQIGFRPDIIHVHDWETGAVSVYLKTLYRNDPFFYKTATVFTFHNLGYQGTFPPERLSTTGIPYSYYNPEGIEFWGQMSLLKGGIVFSDGVTTISPSYGREALTPEYGMGMEGVLNKRNGSVRGILNGVDYERWNPSRDPHIAAVYDVGDLSGKEICRKSLLDEFGLTVPGNRGFVLGWVSRLVKQKGVDLLFRIMDRFMGEPVVLVMLGAGEYSYQKQVQAWSRETPGRIAVTIGYDEKLARRILAGSDLFILPSRYEPCGTVVMQALRYGTIPVVRRTGGLSDIVKTYDPDTGEGWGFPFEKYDHEEFFAGLHHALSVLESDTHRKRIVENAMGAEFGWEKPAREYVEEYRNVMKP